MSNLTARAHNAAQEIAQENNLDNGAFKTYVQKVEYDFGQATSLVVFFSGPHGCTVETEVYLDEDYNNLDDLALKTVVLESMLKTARKFDPYAYICSIYPEYYEDSSALESSELLADAMKDALVYQEFYRNAAKLLQTS